MLGWLLGASLLCGAGALLGLGLWLESRGRAEPPAWTADVVIVPGARVWPDGRPSKALAERVRRAVALVKADVAPVLLVSGGPGDHPGTEADAGALLAETLGLTGVIREGLAKNTAQNASLSAELLATRLGRPAGEMRVVVVTQQFHAFRCERLFSRHFGQVAVVGLPMQGRNRVKSIVRECASLLRFALVG